MDKWIVLGIEKTDDEEALRKAYRAKLVKVNPEDDPQGFMELREAYEAAVYEINHKDASALTLDDDAADGEVPPDDELTQIIRELYMDYPRRINVAEWEALFETDYFVSLEMSEESNDKLLTFLMDNYRLPRDVWRLICDEIDIEKNKDELKQRFPEDYIDYVQDSADFKSYLTFDLLEVEESAYVKVDEYIQHYFDLRSLLGNKEQTIRDIEKEASIIDAMEATGIHHPYLDVSRLFYELNVIRTEAPEDTEGYKAACMERLAIAKDVLALYPEDFYLIIFCGDLAQDGGDYDTAKYYYELAYEQDHRVYLTMHKLAANAYYREDYKRANDLYIEILDGNPDDFTALEGMNASNVRLVEKLSAELDADPKDTSTAINLAWALYRTSDFKGVKKLLRKIKPTKEQRCTYSNLLGRGYYYTNNYEKALKHFKNWMKAIEELEKRPDEELPDELIREKGRMPYVHFWLAECYIGLKEYDEAREHLAKSFEGDYSEIRYAYEVSCKLEYDLGEYEACIEACERALDKFPDSYIPMIFTAKSLYALDEFSRMIGLCNHIIWLYPYYYEAYTLEMDVYFRVEQWDDVKNVIEWYDQTGAKSDHIEYYRARYKYVAEEDYEGSNEILLGILDNRKKGESSDLENYSDVYYRIVLNYEQLEDEKNTLYYAKEALKDDPDDVYFIETAADNSHILGDFKRAYDYYDYLLAHSDRPATRRRSYAGKAAALSCMGEFGRSAEVYKKALDEFRLDGTLTVDYAELLVRMNNLKGCVELLEKTIEETDDDGVIQTCLGNLCCFYGNDNYVDKAYETFKRAIEHQPDDFQIYRSMGNIYLEHEMYEDAKELLYKGLEMDTEKRCFIANTLLIAISKTDDVYKDEYSDLRVAALDQCRDVDGIRYIRRAELYRALGDYEEALRSVQLAIDAKRRAFDTYVQSADAWDEKGNIYMEMGEHEKALCCYEMAVSVFGHYNIYEDKVKKLKAMLAVKQEN